MKRSAHLALSLVLTVFWPVVSSAQNSVLKEKIKKFKNSKRYDVRYDKFDDQTLVRVGPFFLSADLLNPSNNFQMMAAFSYAGQSNGQPVEQYELVFISNGQDWSFLDDRDLKAIVDGERKSFGEAKRKGDIGRNWLGEVRVKEALFVTVPAEDFRKISEAKKVEMRLGRKEFKLKDEHLQAFRDLQSLAATDGGSAQN